MPQASIALTDTLFLESNMRNFLRRYATAPLGIVLACSATGAFGIDAENMARRAQRHNDWISLSFAAPNTGMMLGTRASTTDNRTGANLVLDYSLHRDCALVGTTFIFERKVVGPEIKVSDL